MMTTANLDVGCDELGEEFQKLALLIPTIPKDQCLSELEIIEFVITYIRQLQQILSYDQWNEHINQLEMSTKNSLNTSSSPHLFNQLILPASKIQTNESSTITRRSPLATINPDNTQLA